LSSETGGYVQNFSSYYQDALDDFESTIVPSDQGDAGKGQVNARAVYKINIEHPDIGYITKNPGQTQYHGISVDACHDRSDGTGADFLTDVALGDGTSEIRIAYTPYAPPPPGTPLPPENWLKPTDDMLHKGGPLVLKSGNPEPEPEPPPSQDWGARFDAIDASLSVLSSQLADSTERIIETDDENTEKIQTQIHDLVEDVEESLLKLGKVLLWLKRRGRRENA
jgi:hypothetical protein